MVEKKHVANKDRLYCCKCIRFPFGLKILLYLTMVDYVLATLTSFVFLVFTFIIDWYFIFWTLIFALMAALQLKVIQMIRKNLAQDSIRTRMKLPVAVTFLMIAILAQEFGLFLLQWESSSEEKSFKSLMQYIGQSILSVLLNLFIIICIFMSLRFEMVAYYQASLILEN